MAETARLCPASILRAATELMAESGYAAMSMRQLASRVGILPGSLYHHVTCKQDLLLNVLIDIIEVRLRAWECSTHTADLNGFVRFLLERHSTHPHEHTLLVYEIRYLEASQRKWLEQAHIKLSPPLKRLIEHSYGHEHHVATDITKACAAILSIIEAAKVMYGHLDGRWIEEQTIRMCHSYFSPPVAVV